MAGVTLQEHDQSDFTGVLSKENIKGMLSRIGSDASEEAYPKLGALEASPGTLCDKLSA